MNILVVGKVTDNQVERLKEEAVKRGHRLFNCASYDLINFVDSKGLHPVVEGVDFKKINLIYLLTVGDRKWEWYVACQHLAKTYKTAIIENKVVDPNYKLYYTPTSEMVKQATSGIKFPKTAVVLHEKTVDQTIKKYKFPIIIKNTGFHRGRGIFLVNSAKEVKKIIEEADPKVSFLIREYIPNNGDVRVFTVGFKAIGAMKRTPQAGDFRSNISRGGHGEKFDLDSNPQIKKIAEKMSLINQSEVAGVDIIIHQKTKEPYVLEINRGPQFSGLEKFTGVNAAGAIVGYFEKRYQETRGVAQSK